MIQILPNSQVNRQKWNDCVCQSEIGSVYALAEYLDVVCPQWQAVVLDDYKAVMPLPIKQRLGFRYVVQPIFSQQYGIYSQKSLQTIEIQEFIKIIQSQKSVRMCFAQPLFPNSIERKNYVLPLQKSYDNLAKNFSENTRRNIVKARKNGVVCQQEQNSLEAFQIYFSRFPKMQNAFKIEQLLQVLPTRMYVAKFQNEVCAMAVFIQFENRFYYLFASSSDEGKRQRAAFVIVDTFISEFAQTNVILDFEGSEIAGVERFYRGFGAVNMPYYFYKNHKLPLLGKFIK